MLIINIKELFGIRKKSYFLKGKEMSVLPSIKNAFIRIEGNEIVEFGVMKNLKSNPKVEIRNPNSIMDTKGGFVLPAWCDFFIS